MSERTCADNVYIPVENARLLTEVRDLKADGYRLVQICADTVNDGFEILYSFDKNNALTHLKLLISQEDEVESISGDYSPAYIYENEMNELYGIRFNHMTIDYKGSFFHVAEEAPCRMNSRKEGE